MSGAAITTDEVLARLTRLEQEVAAGKQAAVTKERDGWADDGTIGRRRLLKMAGLAAAAGAGTLLITATEASAADGDTLILGHSGDSVNPNLAESATEVHLDGTVNPKVVLLANDTTYTPNQSAYSATLGGWGTSRAGVYALSVQGTGIVANGGFNGVLALCSGTTGAGVNAIGGSNGPGVLAQGQGTGRGVLATGGTSSGAGVRGVGGFPNGTGVEGYGLGTGPGVYANGGSNNGLGLNAIGGQVNGIAIMAQGTGTGAGMRAAGGSSGGNGVEANAGDPNGTAVLAYGPALGTGDGVSARGGLNGGNGVTAFSNGTGYGIYAIAAGPGSGGYFSGGRANVSLGTAITLGPPTTGLHYPGDVWVDSNTTLWCCIVQGTPGTFVPLQSGGLNQALYTAVSTQQYTLTGSDGVTWRDIDATNLKLVITPGFNCQAIIAGNSDLWTSTAGYNQDIAIFVSGGSYGAGQVVAWKESGGFAGTYSPNAAFVETVAPLVAGTAYTIKLQWKANKPDPGTIWAGAGPINGQYSPTRLRALLIVSQ